MSSILRHMSKAKQKYPENCKLQLIQVLQGLRVITLAKVGQTVWNLFVIGNSSLARLMDQS